MITRYAILCAGCDQEILVRLSVYPCEGIRFYFPCPKCEIPITGRMRGGQEIESLVVNFDDCEKVGVGWTRKYDFVVTVAPNIPLKRTATHLGEIGGAPNAMILHIAGDNAEQVVRRLSIFNQHHVLWPDVRRFYEYYLRGQWERFTDMGRKVYAPDFADPSTAHGRESVAYRAVAVCISPTATRPFGEMLSEIIEHMPTVFEAQSFRAFAVRSVASGELQREQRRIWDCLCLLMNISEMWFLPGILWEQAEANSRINLDELSMCRDEFHQLRDAYVTCFEACCKTLMYLLAFINTSARGAPGEFIQEAPPGLRISERRTPPKSFARFKRLPNAEKLTYLYEWPIVSTGLNSILNSKLRNSLGHNSVRHDLRTDMIVADDGNVMRYFEFTAAIYRLNTALHILMNITHSVRMAATQES